MRVKKVESGQAKYYLRSSILGGQVIAEINQSQQWTKGFIYGASGELLAIQEGAISFIHQDPVTKSQRITNSSGAVQTGVDLDPWGGETNKSFSLGTHARKYTTYDRDLNGDDEAQQRKYKGNLMRFTQPDPFDGSLSLADPQSFNRYSYTQNDPVNFTDPSGLFRAAPRPSIGTFEMTVPWESGSIHDRFYSDHWGTNPFDTYGRGGDDSGDDFDLELDPSQTPQEPQRIGNDCLDFANIVDFIHIAFDLICTDAKTNDAANHRLFNVAGDLRAAAGSGWDD